MYLNFPEFWPVGEEVLVIRARLGDEMSGFVLGLRFSFFQTEKLSITSQNFFSKCLKNGSSRLQRDNWQMPGCGSANKTNSYPGPEVVKGRRRISSPLSSHRRGNFY